MKMVLFMPASFLLNFSRKEPKKMTELGTGVQDKYTQFTKARNRLLSSHADVEAREIAVLLLRLRQICDHPSLVRSMSDQEFLKQSGIMESENLDRNLLSQINSITLQDAASNDERANEQEIGVDRRVATNILASSNPVFRPDISSKVEMVLGTVKKILLLSIRRITWPSPGFSISSSLLGMTNDFLR